MELIKIIGIAIVAVISIITIKQQRAEIAVIIGIAASAIILLLILNMLSDVVKAFSDITDKTGLSGGLYKSILKIIGIGYLTEFAGNICDDAGSKSIGDKVLMSGKIIILVMALPILLALIDIVASIVQ
jgi:stage III sporulation protein AD